MTGTINLWAPMSWSPSFMARKARRIAEARRPRALFMGEPIEGENAKRYREWLARQ